MRELLFSGLTMSSTRELEKILNHAGKAKEKRKWDRWWRGNLFAPLLLLTASPCRSAPSNLRPSHKALAPRMLATSNGLPP